MLLNCIDMLCHDETLINNKSVIWKNMHAVTISAKFQVPIPRAIREALQLSANQKLCMLHFDHRLQSIVQQDAKTLRGALTGMDTNIDRT